MMSKGEDKAYERHPYITDVEETGGPAGGGRCTWQGGGGRGGRDGVDDTASDPSLRGNRRAPGARGAREGTERGGGERAPASRRWRDEDGVA